jgi:hypothetical protein
MCSISPELMAILAGCYYLLYLCKKFEIERTQSYLQVYSDNTEAVRRTNKSNEPIPPNET